MTEGLFGFSSGQQSRNPSSRPDSPARQQRGSAQHGGGGGDREQQQVDNATNQSNPGWVPRPKRIACVICRRRKLRCDGNKPSCGTCSRLGHDCAYDEVRKKSGPKRGYVKQLEARLAQVETLLKSHDPGDVPQQSSAAADTSFKNPTSGGLTSDMTDIFTSSNDIANNLPASLDTFDLPSTQINLVDSNIPPVNEFSWEMIGLGLEEPLPTQDVIDELNDIYFRKIHPSVPILHRPRYYAAMDLAPSMRPPVCLRYIMWCLASSITDKYQSLHPHFYQRARKYVELDQMKGLGEGACSVAHTQAWILIAFYEFKMMYFPRAWMSTGSGMRLALMLGLHRQDGVGAEMKHCIPPPRDWTEREERRRTFWVAFCQDRYASLGTGWPMMVDERDILTDLPSTEEAFINCKPQPSYTLSSVLAGENISTLSPLAGVVLLSCLFGRSLNHLHRTTPNDKDHDLNGVFWKRHRALDNILLNTSLSLPSHLRLPEGVNDSSVIFLNMCIHTNTICLHQAAIFKAEKNNLPNQIALEGKRRCIVAADQITNILKMASHIDLTAMNPFLAFCLYVASRVFMQYLKSRPDDEPIQSSLRFLLGAMNALKHKSPLTESFLMQLDADLEGSGLNNKGTSKSAYSLRQERTPIGDHCAALKARFQQDAQQPPENPPTSSTYDQNTTSLHSSLPNRQKPSTPTTGKDGHTHTMTSMESFIIPTDEDFIRSMAMEMDVSTEASGTSDRQYLSSDHPTPSTNQSSNSSVSQHNLDQSSNHAQQQQPQQHNHHRQTQSNQTNMFATDIPVSQFESNSSGIQTDYTNYFAPGNTLPNTLGFENPFAYSAGWQTETRRNQPREPVQMPASVGQMDEIPNLENMAWPAGADIQSWDNYSS
ncbi:hypothetical protein AJ79_00327 [Helicocarpus griseus UAMH5409]|uniref:Zn(2)-C6 fungal-type domain-containing protein n=1 Tax=Helicocarpus griseus UAMH5409 TaxID=1447875 RepID=A0A2B7YCB7_9EURO|nr:hypothetical protein AJ79_00327 [Helicocarpus griseus UAMH5409]